MKVPSEVYTLQQRIGEHLSPLSVGQQRGLAWWVYGTLQAHSACQTAVITALLMWGKAWTLRQRLREWLYDGADKAAPCQAQVAVETCFGLLLKWILSLWQGRELALAIDATLQHQQVTALVISVLYRGSAIPVAWHILPANRKGPWMGPILRLLDRLHPVVPQTMTVLVLADRGLWSPRLWRRLRKLGWHPLLRVQCNRRFYPAGAERCAADTLLQPGQVWVGRGGIDTVKHHRLTVTLIAIWLHDQPEPWVVVTDLPPDRVGPSWYALRMWIELGFRVLKGVGWQWQRCRRTDPQRVARYWLILAVATLWAMAYGTRAEDAERLGIAPAHLRSPPAPLQQPIKRDISVFQRGLAWLQRTLCRARLWRRLWLAPEPWPSLPPGLTITIHCAQ